MNFHGLMARKPWPMRWIVVSIVVFIAAYTYLTLRYRKPTSFLPYEDARERKHIAAAGYSRITLLVSRAPEIRASRPDDAMVRPAPGGLPPDLAGELIRVPVLPLDIGAVGAAAAGDAAHDYSVRFDCALPPLADRWAVGGAHLYRKGRDLFIVVDFAPLADGLAQRVPETRLLLTLPLASIDPGDYRVILIGTRRSRQWTLQVH